MPASGRLVDPPPPSRLGRLLCLVGLHRPRPYLGRPGWWSLCCTRCHTLVTSASDYDHWYTEEEMSEYHQHTDVVSMAAPTSSAPPPSGAKGRWRYSRFDGRFVFDYHDGPVGFLSPTWMGVDAFAEYVTAIQKRLRDATEPRWTDQDAYPSGDVGFDSMGLFTKRDDAADEVEG